MQFSRLAIASTIGLASILTLGNPVASAPAPLFAVLLGGNEVDNAGLANKGAPPPAIGSATVNIAQGKLCYGIAVSGITTPIRAAHIHRGPAGVNGGVVVALTPPATSPGASSGCVSNLSSTLLQQIQSSPSDFYVNVHNQQFPGGALRGQLF